VNDALEGHNIQGLGQHEKHWRDLYLALFENSHSVMLIIDPDTGAIVDANATACRFYGYDKASLTGMTISQTNTLSPEQIQQEMAAARSQRRNFFSFRHRLAGGQIRDVEVHSGPIALDQRHYLYSIVHDVTDQKRLEESLRQTTKMEAIFTLAGGIAHDFNNLLMGIQGRVSLMLLDVDNAHPFFTPLKKIEDAVNSARELTGQLLGFAKGGKYEVRSTRISDLVTQTADMIGRAAKGIRIVTGSAEDLWPVAVDQDQIKQVLLALCLNAWQAMPEGGELGLQCANARITPEQAAGHHAASGNYVKVTVSDTGVGMDEAILPRIFDPFFTTKHRIRGTGLGLASAYGIIANHNGFITVASEIGRGSVFGVFLPALSPAPAGTKPPEATPGPGLILLVDDEELVTDVGQSMLEKMGFEVLTASRGQDAIELLEHHGERIGLIILDMVMPQMSGGETFERLRQISPGARILISSGYSLDAEAEALLSRGGAGFIQKPFTFQRLSQKVKEVLG